MKALQLNVLFWNLARKYAKTYTDDCLNTVSGGLHWRGSVEYLSDLPADPEEGDCYTVEYKGSSGTLADGTVYAWGIDGAGTAQWIALGIFSGHVMGLQNGTLGIDSGGYAITLQNGILEIDG